MEREREREGETERERERERESKREIVPRKYVAILAEVEAQTFGAFCGARCAFSFLVRRFRPDRILHGFDFLRQEIARYLKPTHWDQVASDSKELESIASVHSMLFCFPGDTPKTNYSGSDGR